MNIQKFEEICKKSRMKLVHREQVDGMEVYIADGLKPKEKGSDNKVHRTLFAVGDSPERLLVAQNIDFDPVLIENMKVENRVRSAMEKAYEVVAAFAMVRKEGVKPIVH